MAWVDPRVSTAQPEHFQSAIVAYKIFAALEQTEVAAEVTFWVDSMRDLPVWKVEKDRVVTSVYSDLAGVLVFRLSPLWLLMCER